MPPANNHSVNDPSSATISQIFFFDILSSVVPTILFEKNSPVTSPLPLFSLCCSVEFFIVSLSALQSAYAAFKRRWGAQASLILS